MNQKNKIILILSIALIVLVGYIIYNEYSGERFSKRIVRQSTEENARIIEIAENYQPKDGKWFSSEFDGVLIADCVNKEAIEYYSNLIDSLKEGFNILPVSMDAGHFEYYANINYIESDSVLFCFAEPYVLEVELEIRVSFYCGSLCGMGFTKKRKVILNPELEVILVIGDDIEPSVIVS